MGLNFWVQASFGYVVITQIQVQALEHKAKLYLAHKNFSQYTTSNLFLAIYRTLRRLLRFIRNVGSNEQNNPYDDI